MDKQEIIDLITATVKEQNNSLLETLNATVNGAVTKITKETDKRFAELQSKTPESKNEERSDDLSTQALQQQLDQIKAEREAEKAEALATKRQNALLQDLGSRKLNATGILQKVLLSEYGDKLEESNGGWYVKDGETVAPLSKVIDTFLATPDGLVFQPPASNVAGNGSKAGNVQQKAEPPKGLADLMAEALAKK